MPNKENKQSDKRSRYMNLVVGEVQLLLVLLLAIFFLENIHRVRCGCLFIFTIIIMSGASLFVDLVATTGGPLPLQHKRLTNEEQEHGGRWAGALVGLSVVASVSTRAPT